LGVLFEWKYLTSLNWDCQLHINNVTAIEFIKNITNRGLDISYDKVTISSNLFNQHMKEDYTWLIPIQRFGVDESKVTPDARFREDLEADSLDLVELIMAFEDKFGGEISDEDAQQITTVGDAVTYIDERMVKE